ncbi:MAG: hypothetical protein WCP45_03945 [Verrucomicrobiota bacterium]
MQTHPQLLLVRLPAMVACSWLAAGAFLTTQRAAGQNFQVGLSSETQVASDVSLVDSEMNARWRDKRREVSVMAGLADLRMDYMPSPWDLTGTIEKLGETRSSAQVTWREALDQPWRWNFSGGGYVGYTDYRSMWLNEYYRQIFLGVPGYKVAEPAGLNASVGGTYEYLPQSGMINWSVGWQSDVVAPAYDKLIGVPLQRGLGRYETWRFGLGSEHVLSPTLRFKQDAAAFETSARAWRFTYKAESLWALTDTWTTRFSLEGSHEANFHSGAAAVALEHDWEARWFAGIQTRAYSDNGQIVDPSIVSGNAPPIDTLQLQLTLRYAAPKVTWRLAVGPYLTHYAAPTSKTLRFTTLYRDRDWLCAQAACTWRF